jgi:hypothetical protein
MSLRDGFAPNLARLKNWDKVPGGGILADTQPWEIQRLFFPHCRMEPAWAIFFLRSM